MATPWTVTGEAVQLDLRPAAMPSRVVAGLVDAAVQLLLLGGLVTLAIASAADGTRAAWLLLVSVVSVGVGYPVGWETLTRGRTPGKAWMGLRVVRDDGGPIGFRHALVRGLLGLFVERPGLTMFSAAVITSLLNDRGKRLGDLLAGTVVVQARVPGRLTVDVEMPPGLGSWARSADLSAVPDQVLGGARQLASRWRQLTPAARTHLAGQLAAEVRRLVHPPMDQGAPDEQLLWAVLAERRRRAAAAAEGLPRGPAAALAARAPAAPLPAAPLPAAPLPAAPPPTPAPVTGPRATGFVPPA